MRYLAPVDLSVFVQRNHQRTAKLAERSIEVRLLDLGLIFLRENQHDTGLVTERLAPAR
jgi:hypothetical protein